MKKKLKLTFFLLLAVLTGSSYSQTDSSCSFYPLNIGDLWQYQVMLKLNNSDVDTIFYALKQVLGDTLMSNGYSYKIVEEENLYSSSAGDRIIRYILVDSISANVYEYDEGNNQSKGILIDSLKCQQGDRFGDSYFCETTGTDTILDYETEYKDISQVLPDVSTQHTLARDIGISYQNNDIMEGYGGNKTFELVYANTNGEIYGEFISSIHETNFKVAHFLIIENYPNPFNSVTQIQFMIPENLKVKIDIFNSSGERVYEFMEKNYSAGYHKLTFNGTNLPSGTYFVRVSAGDFSGIRKIVLLK